MSVIEQNNAQIKRLRDAISDAYAACDEKDATMPSSEVMSNLADCIRSIQHGVPDGYINSADTWLYSMSNKFASGVYAPASDTVISSAKITVGFKPKIFVIRIYSGYNNSSSRPYINCSWMVVDNNYEYAIVKPDGSNDARTGSTLGFTYDTANKRANSAMSNGAANVFYPTENGVAGSGSGSYYFKAGVTFFWFAWG